MVRAAVIAVLIAAVFDSAAQAKTITFSVTSVSISIKPTDVPPKGTSKGDTIQQSNRLLNTSARFGRPKGAVVGSDHGTMTFTSARAATYSGVVVLPGGTVKLKGSVVSLAGNKLVIPVVGGTGRFAHAHGSLLVGSGSKRTLNTYRLTFSGGNVA